MFCTKAVVIATFVFGFAIYLIDLAIHGLFNLAGVVVQKIFG
jgi:preprotein translocase subunit SecE